MQPQPSAPRAPMDEAAAIAARVVRTEAALQAGRAPEGPWTLEVYPTLRCNLSCRFCDTTDRHRPPQHELSEARWLQIVDEAAAAGARRIMVLGGGEPLVAEATPALMRRARAHGMTGFLTTNGTRLGRLAPLLAEIGWEEVHVSIDGATPATHDALRGQPGAFRQSVRGLCALRGRGGPTRLGLHTVVTRANVDELPDIVRLAAALGCGRVDFDHLIAYRPEQAALALGPAERARLPDVVARTAEVARARGIVTTAAGLLGGRGDAPPAASPASGLAGAPCLKAWHHLVIQADGRVAPCCVLSGEGGAVGTLAQTWAQDPFLERVRAGMRAHAPLPRCRECSSNILAHEHAIRARIPEAG